ncbi:SDR family NAD(P)-dependent oxidoreductase [Caulobacter segnis]|uniref:SDR family NAD(P)-dependent oxidoreductase n=1 Tax=Caulobacter segnis TaxID=88688 RepID=UPI001CBE74F6|nr:SDR family NAD(P)-dependent oxidoreductase [Caulobacter segnis]UAL11728.1 SDR family NAD(P)-dependent oxidoreductase [Caulobacter segnis]
MSKTQRLAGRTVLITGASSGIGARFARIVAAEGAAVVIGARRVDRLQTLRDEIVAAGGKALAVALDVADEASTIAAYDAAETAFGPVDGVVANAGIQVEGLATEIAVEDFDQVFAVNVRGVFLTAREGAKRMRASGVAERGRIVIVSSITAKMVTPGVTAYSASKAAVSHMGRHLAREWARQGPNVNNLCPGYIKSELAGDWFETEGGHKQMSKWPRRRILDEDALDPMLIYLLSDESKGVTGADFTIDDGQSL